MFQMNRRSPQIAATPASLNTRKSPLSGSRGRLVALFAFIFMVAAILLSTMPPLAESSTAKERSASTAKPVAPARASDRKSSRRRRRAATSRKGTAKREKHEAKESGSGESAAERYETLLEQEEYWATRLTYPTGVFDP